MSEWRGGSGVALCHPKLTNRGVALLRKAVRKANFQESQFFVCSPDDIPAGARVVVALGDEAQSQLTGWGGGKQSTKYTRGYVLPSHTGLTVMPTFDPEIIPQGQMKLLGLFMQDISTSVRLASRGFRYEDPKDLVDYKVGLGALRELVVDAKANPELLIAFDLETEASAKGDEDETIEFSRDSEDGGDGQPEECPENDNEAVQNATSRGFERDALDTSRASITTVQFSIRSGTGVSCEWGPEAKELTQQLFDLPNPKAGHNTWLFDRPILLNHGIEWEDIGDDTMWMWHHLQPDLPAHLQGVSSLYGMPFPWKHMAGGDLAFYGAADVDAVQRIMLGLPRDLQRLGLWQAYQKYVRGFRPILADMERRGIPVSAEKLGELRTWLQEEIVKFDGELQPLIPSDILVPAKKEPYAGIPNEVKRALKETHPAFVGVAKSKQSGVMKALTLDDPLFQRVVKDSGFEIREGKIWKSEKKDFNPRSPLQIKSYLQQRGYPIPKRFKDGKDSTADKELERLEVSTGDQVIKLSRLIRAYSKMGNAYAGKVLEDGTIEGGWYPGPDGRVRATFTFGPATGQMAAREPSVLTTPKRRPDLAKKFRECIRAESGHLLVEHDFRAYHARTLGLAAESANYMRLADMDIHSYLTGHLVHYKGIETCLDLPDDDLRAYLKEIKSQYKAIRDFKAKPTILGVGFKMGYRRLYFENRDSLQDVNEAKYILDTLKGLFPEVFQWQDDICEKADRDHRLINSWGAVRWFWDIFKWQRVNGEWRKSSSKDAEKVVAYLPSSNAHYMFRDKLLQAQSRGWLDRYQLINYIHDAVLFHCPKSLVDECVYNITELLQSPVPELANRKVAPEGFTCAVEASVGEDWARMEEVK